MYRLERGKKTYIMRSFLVVCVCLSLGIQCEVGMRRVNAVAVVEVAEASCAGESLLF